MRVAQEIPKVAGIFGMSEEALLWEMVTHFLEEEMADTEQRIGRLHFEVQKLRRKYRMGLNELTAALDRLEDSEDYEQETVNGIPVAEAVADTRAWEHIIENLAREEKKLVELSSLFSR